MIADAELLRRFVDEQSEAAFTEIVGRHLNLVYSAALRQTAGDGELAREVAQQVFTALARKAAALARHPAPVAWLYRTTRYAAIDAVRARSRRERHETEGDAIMMNQLPDESELGAAWEQLRPVLDAAMNELAERDRQAVLLRYFEGRSYGEIGDGLGLTENAARMRVERALEKLRGRLARRGLTSTGAALAVVLGEQAVVAAPAGLAATIAVSAAGAAAAAGGGLTLWQILTMNKLTVAIITGLVVAGASTAVHRFVTRWDRQEMTQLRQDNERLRRIALNTSAGKTTVAKVEAREIVSDLAARLQERNAQAKAAAGAASTEKHVLQNRGMGAPAEALETFTWACYTGDVEAIAKQLYFTDSMRKKAEAILAGMPEPARKQWPTPELLYGFFTAADCLIYPPPSDPEMLKKAQLVFLASDRVAFRRPGETSGGREFQWTAEGWKVAYPEVAIEDLANEVMRTNPMPQPEGGN